MIIKTYDQAIKYLEMFIKPVVFEKISQKQARLKDPLDRMRKLLNLLGNPQDGFKSVLIGGTSGKGSTAYFVSHILKTAGYKTGLTISPHLQKVNERIQINDIQILDEEFISLLNEIIPAVEEMQRKEILKRVQNDNLEVQDDNCGPSYFEILIAMAFLYFKKQKVDIAVVEVGMGGVYDATNTLNPLISVITNVSLDHTDILGKTVEKIAREKAGIIKKFQISNFKYQISNKDTKSTFSSFKTLDQSSIASKAFDTSDTLDIFDTPIVVTGVRQKAVIKIVEERCKEVGAKLYRLGRDFNYEIKKESIEGTEFDLVSISDRGLKLDHMMLSAMGGYQVENASLAIQTVLELQKFGFNISEQNIRTALSTSFFPGRFEVMTQGTSSVLILDGAHNLAKMKAFLSSLKKIYPNYRKIFIVAFKDDKDAKGMLKEIMKVADAIIITEFNRTIDVKRHGTMALESIKNKVLSIKGKKEIEIILARDSKQALEKGIEIASRLPRSLSVARNDESMSLIVVTGSLYLVGEVRNLIFTL